MSIKTRKFADDGWGIWIDGDDRSTVYLNEWINPKGKSYVDIGVRIYGAKKANDLNIYVPFEITEHEIADYPRNCRTTIFCADCLIPTVLLMLRKMSIHQS